MPIYEYRCRACGSRFEALQKLSDPPLAACRSCSSSEVEKLISPSAFQFKGSGWYVTDYARKGGNGSAKAAGEGSGGGKGEAPAEGKPEARPETKGEAKGEAKGEGKASTASTKTAGTSSEG